MSALVRVRESENAQVDVDQLIAVYRSFERAETELFNADSALNGPINARLNLARRLDRIIDLTRKMERESKRLRSELQAILRR